MTTVRVAGRAAARLGGKGPVWRIGAIALFLGLPVGAAALILSDLVAGLDAADRADHAKETALVIIHQLDRRPEAAEKPSDTTSLFLGSTSTSLAQAELQALVAGRIEAVGGRLTQLQPLDGTEQDPPGRVAAEITFTIGNVGLLDVLHAIEAGLPILYVPRVEIQPELGSDASDGTEGVLRVTMMVQGPWRAAP